MGHMLQVDGERRILFEITSHFPHDKKSIANTPATDNGQPPANTLLNVAAQLVQSKNVFTPFKFKIVK